jgi:predicted phage terminase large subunit-like protein
MLSADDITKMRALPMGDVIKFWDALEKEGSARGSLDGVIRELCQKDLFYLLVRVCGRVDMLHPWVFARVREVEADPNGRVDLWARGHGKSSTITFGKTIQDILNDPEITFGIFSHTRPIAKAFLRQIMREFEGNKVLHKAFPDILWGMDTRQSPKWSEDDGLIVRRKSNPPEATIEAWGLVDGQPTSKHFKVLLYDDIVVEGSVTTPEMIDKTMKALEQSYNLSNEVFVRRFAGTRWHFNDAYKTVIDRGTAVPREHPGTVDGTEYGDPVFWTKESILEKRRDMGPHTFAAQILLNPKADSLKGFKREWLRYYSTAPTKTNNYILIDAASSKKKGSDYTAMWVVGLGTDGNYYALDIVRDRLSLTERTERLFALHRKWKPLQVRYEKYGAMADIEHIKTEQEKQQYRFDITEVGGQTSKVDRIGRLIPVFEQGKFYLPKTLHVTNYEKVTVDLVHTFIEQEYMPFPVGVHDDMADSLARLLEPDLKLVWPKEEETRVRPEVHVVHRGWR